jgi:endonuclease G
VNLPEGSEMQLVTDLSLYPQNIGKQMKVLGSLTNYLGTAGTVVATGAISEFYIVGGGGIFRETFESEAADKKAYATADFVGTAATWEVAAVIIKDDSNDKKFGSRSARLRDPNNSNPTAHYIKMKTNKPNGAGIISLYHGMYSNHTGGSYKLEVSNDDGVTWNAFTQDVSSVPAILTKVIFENVNVAGNIRIRITKTSSGYSTINIDNIEITDYTPSN